MSTKLTIFTATLVQDSALSVSGLDRESTSDQPFTLIDGKPILSGRGLKGSAVAMARRFFDPLPRSVSEEIGRKEALRRSAWRFRDARITGNEKPRLRSGVGILQATGARAEGVLYDREVMPKGTKWDLVLRVDWRLAGSDEQAEEVEGILGYVLDKYWKEGRCWLGGGAARGLGFCHLTDLKAYRLDGTQYEAWVESGRTLKKLSAESSIPQHPPTKSWYFRTLDVEVSFGAYRPEGSESDWGVDMLAIGPHEIEQGSQRKGTGRWARPSWADPSAPPPDEQLTQRSILMDGEAPLIPGSSVRGPLRHAFSRAQSGKCRDPHLHNGDVGTEDAAGKLFGTVDQSSALLIRDASAEGDWTAARLHMHAEDEFSAGSYGSAKRDAVRLLSGKFSVRFVIEGGNKEDVAGKQKELDRLIALGQLGHLPIGGHKTKGAGYGVWKPGDWQLVDVLAPQGAEKQAGPQSEKQTATNEGPPRETFPKASDPLRKWIHIDHLGTEKAGPNVAAPLTLKDICEMVPSEVKESLTAWWCEPAIDFSVDQPKTFGRCLPSESTLKVEEAVFFSPSAAFRMAKTKRGWKKVLIQECDEKTTTAQSVTVTETPARLHRDTNRFTAHLAESGTLLIKEWRHQGQTMGYTLSFGSK